MYNFIASNQKNGGYKYEKDGHCIFANLHMKCNIPDRIVKDISLFARKYAVCKVILFGSRARGTHTERSDIDIAVSGGDFEAFYNDIKENVHSLLIFDIINLDRSVSEQLKKEIEKDGVVIYEETR